MILRLLLNALAVIILSYLLPGVGVDSMVTAIIVALVLSILNFLVKPILIVLTLPITIVTLGLFLLVINAIIILIAAHFILWFRSDQRLVGHYFQFAAFIPAVNIAFPPQREQIVNIFLWHSTL